jgi:putative IMPACT (imprinted ancient) family translation regulator
VKVQQIVSHTFVVERSRFVAVLIPLTTPEEIEPVVRVRRAEVRRANHHCWAYRLIGPDGSVLEKARDDGEVGHPGRVLLEILRKHEIEGAIVVSRVFGGVKLGVGGVSRAFRDAGEGAVRVYQTASAPAAPPRGAHR